MSVEDLIRFMEQETQNARAQRTYPIPRYGSANLRKRRNRRERTRRKWRNAVRMITALRRAQADAAERTYAPDGPGARLAQTSFEQAQTIQDLMKTRRDQPLSELDIAATTPVVTKSDFSWPGGRKSRTKKSKKRKSRKSRKRRKR